MISFGRDMYFSFYCSSSPSFLSPSSIPSPPPPPPPSFLPPLIHFDILYWLGRLLGHHELSRCNISWWGCGLLPLSLFSLACAFPSSWQRHHQLYWDLYGRPPFFLFSSYFLTNATLSPLAVPSLLLRLSLRPFLAHPLNLSGLWSSSAICYCQEHFRYRQCLASFYFCD